MLALLPDIHANRQALTAVLADARLHEATAWAALGDIIGFGGAPEACAERLRELGATALRGNHEEALRCPGLFAAFPAVQRMTERTRRLLPAELFLRLTSLPHLAEAAGLPLTHATFHAPERWGRLAHAEEAALSFAAQGAPLALFGHTHRPTLFCMDETGNIAKRPITYDADGSFRLHPQSGKRYLVNPGSVGQPRDGDPRAAYALWDGSTLLLRRVPYDTTEAAAEMRAFGLPESFGTALKKGQSPL